MSDDQKPADPGTAVAAVETPHFRPLSTIESTPLNPKGIITNFPERGIEAARFITGALAKEGVRLDEAGSNVFMTQYYLAHIAEFVDSNGEIIPMPRCVLIGPNGETMQFVSEGGIDSFDLIRTLCGNGPWTPPLAISVVKVRTRRGFHTYRLCIGGNTSNGDNSTMAGGGDQPAQQASDPKVPPKARR